MLAAAEARACRAAAEAWRWRRGGAVKVREMVHLDPGSEPPHELERANCTLRLGREADSLELCLMYHGEGGLRVRVRVRVRVRYVF